MYHDIQTNFSNIKYRERWKIGFYDNEDAGFYNLHTDTAGDTKYRVSSVVAMLSSADDYEGGELHFPDLNKKFKLDAGDVIVFKSSLLHGVHPITKGKRHVLISFFFDDDGIGIPENEYQNVFKPFYKLDKSRGDSRSSVGLGLSITSDIIKSHGGNIVLEKSPFNGLRVKVFLPL